MVVEISNSNESIEAIPKLIRSNMVINAQPAVGTVEAPVDLSSAITGFFKRKIPDRLNEVSKRANLTEEDLQCLGENHCLSLEIANAMVENVIGTLQIPLAIATNFVVNGQDVLIPMAVEEPSVVAAASYGAKMCRSTGGFKVTSSAPMMVGQILMVGCRDIEVSKEVIEAKEQAIINFANAKHPSLAKRGGGVKRVEPRVISTWRGQMLVVHLHVDVCDSMGANAVTTIAEKVAPYLEQMTGGTARMRILSNLCEDRIFTAEAIWTKEELQAASKGLTGDEVVEAILDASAFAEADEYRACTHNKGVMNGIDSVALATLNDTRAIESGAHCYSSFINDGKYGPLTTYTKTLEGHLKGTIRIPLALGTRGGAIQSHPLASVNLKIMRVETGDDLGKIMAAVGLAQNFAAVRALVTEGLCRGHMRLHAKNIAMTAGAKGEVVFEIAEKMSEEGNVTLERAQQLLVQSSLENLLL